MTTALLALALFVYTIAQYGFCRSLADSKFTEPPRRLLAYLSAELPVRWTRVICSFLLTLVECPVCTGFHVGWISAFYALPIFGISGRLLALACIIAGFYTAGANWLFTDRRES